MARLSVAIASYNGSSYLPEQLESIARQSRRPDEVVVSDDNSTDDTVDLLHRFADQAPFVLRLLADGRHRGIGGNFLNAINHCSGDLIVLADQDDVWRSDRLSSAETAFRPRDVGLVACNSSVVDATLKPLGFTTWEVNGLTERVRRSMTNPAAIRVALRRWMPDGHCLAFRRSVVPALSAGLACSETYDQWIVRSAAAVSRLVLIDECLVSYRLHPDQRFGTRAPRLLHREFNRELVGAGFPGSTYPVLVDTVGQLHRQVRSAVARGGVAPGERLPLSGAAWDFADTYLERYTSHFALRAALPRAAHRRVRPVVKELTTGGYNAHSNGLRSAVRDLIRPRVG